MAIPNAYNDRHIYHFTHVKNLPGILKHGVLSYNEKVRLRIPHLSIASESIQKCRAKMPVTAGPGGVVHDYVPFYFCCRSSMLLSVVNAKNVDQLYLLYFGVPIDVLDHSDVVFTDASANTILPPNFYSDPLDLKHLDWTSINEKSWGMPSDEAKQARMAEALVHLSLDVAEIDHIIVWNEKIREKVANIYAKGGIKPPLIDYDGYKHRYFYFTNFYEKGKVSIVTGPMCLRQEYRAAVEATSDERSDNQPDDPTFESVEDAVDVLDGDFCAIAELGAIDMLETANTQHCEGVGAHTRTVVSKLRASAGYEALSEHQKALLVFAAYLHDIGKGNSPRDNERRQRTDPDHPARAIALVQRILTEEVADVTKEDIRQVLLLVVYHDLIGDIAGKSRDRRQMLKVVECEEDFDLLAALCYADVASLIPDSRFSALCLEHRDWLRAIEGELPELREWVLENLEDDE